MTTREEMRSLAGEIVRSYEDRVAGIAQLRETVKMDLKRFQDSRTAMTREVRADLAKGVADRKRDVGSLLNGFGQAHTAMSREMRAELNKGHQALAEDERKRQTEAHEFIAELCQTVAEVKTSVKTLLGEFDSSHNTMSREMRAELTKGRQTLVKGVADRQCEVRDMLSGFSSELAGARDEWQKLTATRQSKRGGVAIAVKPLIEDSVALRHRVFEYIANHPDGTKMTELEQDFGLARIQMAKLLKNLTVENKVEKRELLYFAI